VAVQGIGGLGHLAIQFAARMGFRTIAISRGADKRELAEKLGAQEYVDTQKVTAAEGLQKLGERIWSWRLRRTARPSRAPSTA